MATHVEILNNALKDFINNFRESNSAMILSESDIMTELYASLSDYEEVYDYHEIKIEKEKSKKVWSSLLHTEWPISNNRDKGSKKCDIVLLSKDAFEFSLSKKGNVISTFGSKGNEAKSIFIELKFIWGDFSKKVSAIEKDAAKLKKYCPKSKRYLICVDITGLKKDKFYKTFSKKEFIDGNLVLIYITKPKFFGKNSAGVAVYTLPKEYERNIA